MSLNLLESLSTNFIDFAVEKLGMIDLDWIGKIVQWIIGLVGIVGVGVILFTVILKTVVLPLDIYSRVKMKKQSLIMKKMRPEMEKLQKQYANDKAMYSQKVMELQKENGISMIGACLPMLVTLLIFIFVFQAFSIYSQYANLQNYNDMVGAYNSSVQKYILTDYQQNTAHSDGFLVEFIDETLIDYSKTDLDLSEISIEKIKTLDLENPDIDLLGCYTGKENIAKLKEAKKNELLQQLKEQLKGVLDNAKVYKVDFDAYKAYKGVNVSADFDSKTEADKIGEVRVFVKENSRKDAADYYRNNTDSQHFIWVGNLWYPDSMLNREVPDFDKFTSTVSRAISGSAASYKESYDEVTWYLTHDGYLKEGAKKVEGQVFNGYFVLIVLAIGLMFLQQFISMRSQKDANELGTVDGSAAKQNKWMLIMMPVIYGVFSFFYSAAFSLYMITNTVYGLITTLIINKAMDVSFAKQEANGGYNAKSKAKYAINNRKRLK